MVGKNKERAKGDSLNPGEKGLQLKIIVNRYLGGNYFVKGRSGISLMKRRKEKKGIGGDPREKTDRKNKSSLCNLKKRKNEGEG